MTSLLLERKRRPIRGFTGEYAFLSNFYLSPVKMHGLVYPTAEHAYVACKTASRSLRLTISEIPTPGKTKRFGRKIEVVEGWDLLRVPRMLEVQLAKYEPLDMREQLLDTGDAYLEETNSWGDRFWGVDGSGENNLGLVLMLTRSIYTSVKRNYK